MSIWFECACYLPATTFQEFQFGTHFPSYGSEMEIS